MSETRVVTLKCFPEARPCTPSSVFETSPPPPSPSLKTPLNDKAATLSTASKPLLRRGQAKENLKNKRKRTQKHGARSIPREAKSPPEIQPITYKAVNPPKGDDSSPQKTEITTKQGTQGTPIQLEESDSAKSAKNRRSSEKSVVYGCKPNNTVTTNIGKISSIEHSSSTAGESFTLCSTQTLL